MWCHVLLVVTVLTCTFQREITAEPDDVLCVLLWSGLKKEDLDVNLLKKLQRRNVNVDDLNNEKAIEKCSLSSERPKQSTSFPAEEFVPTKINRYETTNLPRLRKVDYNYAKNEKKVTTSKENDSYNNQNIAEIQRNKDTQLSNIEKLINLLKIFNKTKTSNEEKNLEINRTTTLNKEVKIDSQTKYLDYIGKIFETYMSAKQSMTTTLKPTTQKFNIDIITQQIKVFLENNNNYSKSLFNHVSEPPVDVSLNKRVFNDDEQSLTRKRGSSDIEDFLNLKVNTSGVLESNKTDAQILSTTEIVHETQTVTQRNQSSITEKEEPKPLPDNIILEIAEKVKASVMKDLNLQISAIPLESTTTKTTKETPTPKTIEEKNKNETSSIIQNINDLFHRINHDIENTTQAAFTNTFVMNTQRINETTDPLEDLLDVIKQLKNFKNSNLPSTNPNYKLTQKKNTNNEFHGPINVLYPPLIPVNYAYDAKKQSDNLMPLYVNPYPQSVLHNPVFQKPNLFKQAKMEKFKTSYDDLSDFNINLFKTVGARVQENPTIRAVPIIQTDAVEVPPLGIPVSKSVKAINQNIIVTTKHPMVQYREDRQHQSHPIGPNRYQDYVVRNDRYYTDSEKQPETDVDRAYRTDMERTYDNRQAYSQRQKYSKPHQHVRLDRGSILKRNRPRAAVGNIYQEYLSNVQPIENKSYQSILSRGSNAERFHEKLERPDEWREWQKQYRDLETVTKRDKRLKVASRQQLTMSDLKRNARYDDVHFRNFLKTQQKVNDMLEKILATKNPDKVRSVETPDTVHTITK